MLRSLGGWTPGRLLFSTLIVLLCGRETRGDEQFILLEPETQIRSLATREADRVTIDNDGRRFVYLRQPRLDSEDGQYQAYYSAEARQYVRWPVRDRGRMLIGQVSGRAIAWRPSRMEVHPADRVVVGRPEIRLERHDLPLQAGPRHVAVTSSAQEAIVAATLEDDGQLGFYRYDGRRWRRRAAEVADRFMPGAPLVAASPAPGSRLPTIYTVTLRGELIGVHGAERTQILGDARWPRFLPGTHLASLRRGDRSILFAADQRGRLWEIHPEQNALEPVESREGLFRPGTPLVVVSAAGDRLFAVDQRGHLLGYDLAARGWTEPYLVAGGFEPGGTVSAVLAPAVPHGPVEVLLAVADPRGRIRLFHETDLGWQEIAGPRGRLAGGSTVAMAASDEGMLLSAVQADGRWSTWRHDRGNWLERDVAAGFPVGAAVTMLSDPLVALAVDGSGRLHAARAVGDRWDCEICGPTLNDPLRLSARRVEAGNPMRPVTVKLVNSSPEPIVVRIADVRSPAEPVEIQIPAGGSVSRRFDRDAGGMIEESYATLDPLGRVIEHVHRMPLPPRVLYQASVYADRVTSVYFDRTRNKTDRPDQVNTSLVSLGVFSFPPGEGLQEGDRIDVPRVAARQRNPGAAALFEATQP